MSVETTNCGVLGWTSDETGYRYRDHDPLSNKPWPPMPDAFLDIASRASARVGFASFSPDACLINRYAPDARMTLHRDRNERDFSAPIVSVSLGLSARFVWGGRLRSDPVRRIALDHGDVMVWGGPSRLIFHGVDRVEQSADPDDARWNLTFRRAG